MLVKELQSLLIKLKGEKITLADIGKALGTSGANISKRAINNSRLTIEEIVKLENAFNITLVENKKGLLAKVSDSINEHYLKQYNKGYENFMPEESQQIINSDDCVVIDYIGIKPDCGSGTYIENEPEIKPIKLSNNLITDILRCSDPQNLKCFRAQGDSMETLIEDGDILLVDAGRTDIFNSGIYIFSNEFSEWRCKRFNITMQGLLQIISDNPKYKMEEYKKDEIELKIWGKVIKNLSRGL